MNAHRFSGIRNLLVCLAFTVSLVSSGLAAPPQWVEIKSPHFSVYTDAGEKRGREVAMRFEQMRTVFGTLMVKANVNLPVPLQIVAFRNTKELRQFSPIYKGKPTELAGLFQGGEDRSFIMLDMSIADPWQVVFHEYAHQLMNGAMSVQLDPWFEEGFAVYFSSIEVDAHEARVGKIPDWQYETLRGSKIKIAELFKVRQYSDTYNGSGEKRDVFYAESGMVVHYLFDHQLMPKLAEYLELKMARNMPVEEAFKKAFGMNITDFDHEIYSYIAAGGYKYFKIADPGKVDSKSFTEQPVSEADANAVMADIHLHSPDYQEKAVAEFQEILKADPNNSAALRGLGYSFLRKNDFTKAGEYFQQASKANSKDPRVHYYAALALSRRGSFSDHALLEQATRELETAIALDPNFADSYSLLAFAQSFGGDPAKGLVTMQQAIRISPRNENYQLNLASMYMNNRKADEAIAVYRTLAKSSNATIASQASQMIEFAQKMTDSIAAQETWEKEQEARKAELAKQPPPEVEDIAKPEAKVVLGPPKVLRGTLKSVDCSNAFAPVFTIIDGTKNWKLKIENGKSLEFIGVAKFTCDWTNKKVVAKIRPSGESEGFVSSMDFR